MKSFLVLIALFPLTSISGVAMPTPPETPVRKVIDEYHGIKIADSYRWLENSKDPEVEKWTKAEADTTRGYLDQLPHLADIKAVLEKWNSFASPSYVMLTHRGDTYFALRLNPPKNQPELVVLTSLDDVQNARILVDPNTIDSSGTTAIDWFEPSLDGSMVAVALSKGGSEIADVHFYQTKDGKQLPDVLLQVNKPTAGGSGAWNAEGSGVYYTRYPAAGDRPKEDLDFYQQVYFHKLGTKDDTYSIGKDFPRIAEIMLSSSNDGKYILAKVANGDGGEFAHYVLRQGGEWKQITKFAGQDHWSGTWFSSTIFT